MQKSKNIFPFIWRFLKPQVHFFIMALLFTMITTIFNALMPQILRNTVDSILGNEDFTFPNFVVDFFNLESLSLINALILAGVCILISMAISGLFDYFARMNTAKCSESIIKDMRDTLYNHIHYLPFSWHTNNPTGDIIQRCTSDVTVIQNFISVQLIQVFRVLFLVGFYLGIMFSMNISVSVIALFFFPAIAIYSIIFYGKIAKRFKFADEAEGELMTVVQENLTGVRVVKAFARERHEVKQFDKKNEKWANLWIRLGELSSIYWAGGDFISSSLLLTVLLVCVFQTVNGNITAGDLIAFITYYSALLWPLRSLGRLFSNMSKASVSIERVRYILDETPEQSPKDSVKPNMKGDIVFDNVSFSYDDAKEPVLKNISFTVPCGKTFAILGGTGSGKSTLMHLLDRLYDLPENSGKITIDGVNINDIDLAHLRNNIGIVLQEPFLYSRTIAENIKASAPKANLDDIRHVASIACVDSALEEMRLGYDTIVGERGVTLSGGQKQRVAIARMLMKKAPIKIFDDSLSAVDSETDANIRAALAKHETDSTVILISHRITTLMHADIILVMEDGEIAQQGTHAQLLEQEGIYKKIYEIQMQSEDREFLAKQGGDKHGD